MLAVNLAATPGRHGISPAGVGGTAARCGTRQVLRNQTSWVVPGRLTGLRDGITLTIDQM